MHYWEAHSLKETQTIAMEIKSLVSKGVLVLEGTLGAGKTTFTRFLIESLGYPDSVTSPTYNLIQSYKTDAVLIHHLDLYRIHDAEEFELIGGPSLLEEDAFIIIEWASKIEYYLPKSYNKLIIKILDEDARSFTLEKVSHD